jgi:hypothetical protein
MLMGMDEVKLREMMREELQKMLLSEDGSSSLKELIIS